MTLSLRQLTQDMTGAPARVWRWALLAGLLAQLPAIALMLAPAPAWLANGLALAMAMLTFLQPYAASLAWRAPDLGIGGLLRRFGRSGLIAAACAAVLIALCRQLFMGQLLWAGAPGWAETGVATIGGALLLVLLLRGSLLFNALATGEEGALGALRASFTLTRQAAFRLLLFWAGFLALMVLLTLPVTSFTAALLDRAADQELAQTVALLVRHLLNLVLAALAAVALAAQHRQLSGAKT